MIKLLKISFTVGLILLLLGAIIFVSAFAISGFSFEKMSGIKTDYLTFSESDALSSTKITLNFDTADIYVKFDENADKISVTYPERTSKAGDKLNTVSISESGNSLSIIENTHKKANLFLWDYSKQRVDVTIPKSRTLELFIETDTGDVRLEGDTSLKKLSIQTDTGDISTRKSNLTVLENAYFEADTGDLSIGKLNVASLFAEADTGDIDLDDCTAAQRIELTTDTGDITLTGLAACEAFIIETDTGDIDAENATVDSNSISIETSTGDIEMHLAGKRGDYEISARTRTGDSNIQSQPGSPRKLTIISATGDIEILFIS